MSFRFTKLSLDDEDDLLEENSKISSRNLKSKKSIKHSSSNDSRAVNPLAGQASQPTGPSNDETVTLTNRTKSNQTDTVNNTDCGLTNDSSISIVSNSSIFCFISYLLTVFIFFVVLVIVLICIGFIILSYQS